LLIALVAIFILSNQVNLKGFEILKDQTEILGLSWGIGIFVLFAMAQITILDACGNLLKVFLPKSKLTSPQISQLIGFLGLCILAITIVNPAFNQPIVLLKLSASLSAMVMVIYPIFILKLNLQTLPDYAKPKLWNKVLVWLCVLFYFSIVIWTFV
jgi:hypothetical protein